MSDNVTINSSNGANVIATDEINGSHYQLVKIFFGDNNELKIPSIGTPLPVSSLTNNLETTQQDIKTQLIQLNSKSPADIAREGGNLQLIVDRLTTLLTKYPSSSLNTFTSTSTIINIPLVLLPSGSYQITTTVLTAGQTGIILVPLDVKPGNFSLDVTPRTNATANILNAFVEQSTILTDIAANNITAEYWKNVTTLTNTTPTENQYDVFPGFISAIKIVASGGSVAVRGGI